MIFDQWFLDSINNVPVPKTIRKRIENKRLEVEEPIGSDRLTPNLAQP